MVAIKGANTQIVIVNDGQNGVYVHGFVVGGNEFRDQNSGNCEFRLRFF